LPCHPLKNPPPIPPAIIDLISRFHPQIPTTIHFNYVLGDLENMRLPAPPDWLRNLQDIAGRLRVKIPPPPKKTKQGEWAHLGEPPADDLKYGGRDPISGSMKQLTAWTNKRQEWLKDRNSKGHIWIRTIDSRHYQVWFSSQTEYSKCLEASRKSVKERETTRNAKTSQKRSNR
jgi:hypothetical protein